MCHVSSCLNPKNFGLLFQTRIFRMARLKMRVISEGLTSTKDNFQRLGFIRLETKSSRQWTHQGFVAEVAPRLGIKANSCNIEKPAYSGLARVRYACIRWLVSAWLTDSLTADRPSRTTAGPLTPLRCAMQNVLSIFYAQSSHRKNATRQRAVLYLIACIAYRC